MGDFICRPETIVDWEAVLGINLVDQHLQYMTIAGARKRDHPQSFSYHEPWWDNYKVMADYISRLCVFGSSGEQVNPVLVLEPNNYRMDALFKQ